MIRILLGFKLEDRNLFSMNKMFSIHKFKTVDSTNDTAKEYPVDSVIVAGEQIKGRGRFDREWNSSKGGLWVSIVVKPTRKICEYTFIASLAVFDAVGGAMDIKWPNDLYYDKRKLCGILTEVISVGNKVEKISVGIGLNLNNEVPQEGIALKEIMGKEIDINEILEKILANFSRISDLGLGTILRKYKKHCSMLGKEVSVQTLKGVFSGKAIDIDYEGNLLLETENRVMRLTEGDSSIL